MSDEKQSTPGAADDPDQLRAQIEQTREELGDTVEALSHKVDVKGRVSDGIEDRKQQVKETAAHVGEQAKETAAHARETVAHAGSVAQEQAAEAASSVKATAEQAGQKVRSSDRAPKIAAAVGGLVLLALVVRRRRSR